MPFSRISSRCGLAGDTVCTIGRSVRLAVHLAFVSGPSLAKIWLALSAVAAALAFGGHTAMAADDAPAAGSSFQTEDISIGEPISLPSAPPLAAPAPAATPSGTPFQPPAAQLPSVVVPGNLGPAAGTPAAGTPAPGTQPLTAPRSSSQPEAVGSGWLGIAVDDKLVTGRLVVVEVAQDGPAAKAGIRPQDMLLAMNGNQLQTSDELAASLAAIVPGQQVKMVVGRDNRIEDVVAQASARPPEAVSRDWQSSGFQNAPPQSAGAVPAATPPGIGGPAQLSLAEQSLINELPAPVALAQPGILPTTPRPARAVAEAGATPRLASGSSAPTGRTALGVRTVPVDPNVQSRFHLSDTHGAFVIGVVQDLPAAKAGVPPGSVIVAINNQPVRSPRDLTQLVSLGPVGTPVPIQYVLPGGQSKHADVVLQSLEQPLERALIGGDGGQPAEPPALQPSPLTTRRVQPTAGYQSAESDPLARLEGLLRLMSTRLEQIESRLDRIEAGSR